MGLTIAVGFKREGGGEPVHKHFAHRDADEVRNWMAKDTECRVFVIYQNKTGRRKANPNYKPPGAGAPAESPDLVAEQQEAEAAAQAAEAAEAKAEAAEAETAEVQADEAPAEEAGALELQPTGKLTGKRKPGS